MPKGSLELTQLRKDEIIKACASLYETMSFKDITIRDIANNTSFTRTSVYNYFQTKEEIFLALLQREYEAWIVDLKSLAQADSLDVDALADGMAKTLTKRGCMLKLVSMNLYDMESNSRLENLVEFKKVYAEAIGVISLCIKNACPAASKEDINGFIYAFLPFLFGVYPYTNHTEKQKSAIKLAGVENIEYSVYEITKGIVSRLLRSLTFPKHDFKKPMTLNVSYY